ncbi:MAG TPA: zf-HC2 domain-containing protein [Kofleriaceae bacterium]
MCEQLDAFFDGELASAAGGAFRDHLASCPHCEAALRGRMLEAMVVTSERREPSLARGSMPPAAPSPFRRRFAIGAAGVVALAAAAAIALFIRPSPPAHREAPADLLAVAYDIERGPHAMRGQSAHVGDTLHLRSHATVWIYRGDHELALACAPDASCDLHVAAIGSYSIVTLTGASTRAPHGNLDDDVAAAVEAGAKYRTEQLDVQ